jgi:hypothetical protein
MSPIDGSEWHDGSGGQLHKFLEGRKVGLGLGGLSGLPPVLASPAAEITPERHPGDLEEGDVDGVTVADVPIDYLADEPNSPGVSMMTAREQQPHDFGPPQRHPG